MNIIYRSISALALGLIIVFFAALYLAEVEAGEHPEEELSKICPPGFQTPAKVTEVADGIFVRQGFYALMTSKNAGGIANIGFIIGDETVAVIDSGGSACDGARLKAALRAQTKRPIAYVINSHVHPDHIFGNAAFVGEGTQFVGHYRLKRAMAQRGPHYMTRFVERSAGRAQFSGTKLVPPTIDVRKTLELDLGGRRLLLTAHKTAHTDHDLTVFDIKTKTLWTGDLVFQGHLPVIDGRLKGWLEVLERLRGVAAERAIPGHGPAYIPWPEGLLPQKNYLLRLADDLRALIAQGKSMQDAQIHAAASEKGSWHLFDEFNPRNASTGFAELEWE